MPHKRLIKIKLVIAFAALAAVALLVQGIVHVKDDALFRADFMQKEISRYVYKIGYLLGQGNGNVLASVGALFTPDTSKEHASYPLPVGIPVLRYEGIGKTDGNNVSIKDFENHMHALKEEGYQTVTLDTVKKFMEGEAVVLPEKPILVTFDGGRRDSYYNADPILFGLNFNAVMFVATVYPKEGGHGSFYLSDSELRRIVKSSRWEVQSNGHSVFATDTIDENGAQGRVLSNKLYRNGVLETDQEYKERITNDLKVSKEYLISIGANPEYIALPTGDFGAHSINYPNAQSVFLESASQQFNTVIQGIWPKNNDSFKLNYQEINGRGLSPKRISITQDLSAQNLIQLLKSTEIVTLPYTETFDNPYRWEAVYGTTTVKNNALELKGSDGNIFAYADGTYLLSNYDIHLTVKGLSREDSFSLIARYNDVESYISCQFDHDTVIVKSFTQDGVRVMNALRIGNEYRNSEEVALGMSVVDNAVSCFSKDRPLLRANVSEAAPFGGVGLKIWNTQGQSKSVTVSNVVISTPPGQQTSLTSETDGKEVVYTYLNTGDIASANLMLENVYLIERYKPLTIQNISWNEDPYKEPYWRFIFYSLQPLRHLLHAWEQTGDQAYRDKLIQITESFIDRGMNGPHSWDSHGAAFRTMMLISIYKKLQGTEALTPALASKIYNALYRHGEFLANPNNYESTYNHGVDQAVALYALTRNFPGIRNAGAWESLAEKRLITGLNEIIDADGVLVENSPYYHFYVLEKYWDLNNYIKKYGGSGNLANLLQKKLDQMASYATHILQPNLTTPTIGASLGASIKLEGVYASMADSNAALKYILTKGAQGSPPRQLSVHYPASGQTILRSGWGSEKAFEGQTQVIFDVGPYRTDHSDLDALSFHLFGQGKALIPDTGLYTYEEGLYRNYFHGTYGHNTVVVDGKDQGREKGYGNAVGRKLVRPGSFVQGNGFSYQSGQHSLYEGVTHERAIALLGRDLVVIVDNLSSDTPHTYEQIFHLFPEALLTTDGLNVFARGAGSTLSIRQFAGNNIMLEERKGQTSPPRGLCSDTYEQALACYQLSYKQQGTNASYVTVIELGSSQTSLADVAYDKNASQLTIRDAGRTYTLAIATSASKDREVVIENPVHVNPFANAFVYENFEEGNWNIKYEGSPQKNGPIDPVSLEPYGETGKGLLVKTTTDKNYAEDIDVYQDKAMNLSTSNIAFRIKVDSILDISRLQLVLTDSTGAEAQMNIQSDSYKTEYDGQWVTINYGKSLNRSTLGNWYFTNLLAGQVFDWANVKRVGFRVASKKGIEATLAIAGIWTLPNPEARGSVIIIFDDGWDTTWNALAIMKKYGFKGNVGVITDSINTKRYLSLDQLKELQNVHGWDIVNHTSFHRDAVEYYYKTGSLETYEQDIVSALQYLVQNNINSAPNWFIYPHGKMNEQIKRIIDKYYVFARATQDYPEAYPFADPMNVKIFSVYNEEDQEDEEATPEKVRQAIQDAALYKQPLLLMFHRFNNNPEYYTEYTYQDFERILQYIKQENVDVLTLSELDAKHNIPQQNVSIKNEVPGQIVLNISVR